MKKAFTLIEMLVVIGIIMVLAGASLAAFQGVTKSAERARAQELVSNAATALTMLFDTDGAWPAVIRNTGAVDGRLDERAALPLAKRGFLSATMNDNQTALSGLDKFGLVTPWATTAIKRKGSSATLSTKVNGSSTIQDHILHFAVDLDGDGIIRNASVGGESVSVRATAIVWCCGKDGVLEAYSRGLRKDDVYSWDKGRTRDVK